MNEHSHLKPYLLRALGTAALLAACGVAADSLLAQGPQQRLDDRCIVSVLNRNVRVKADGTWVLPNIPANFGPVRARATCIFDGITVSGESAPFVIPPNGSVNVPRIILGPTTPIPTSVEVTAATTTLTALGATSQLTVTARYSDGSTRDVTAASTGTRYVISNAAIASLTGDGLAQALSSGTVLIQATHEGTSGFVSLQVVLGGDTDRDGIPDDVELALGLNPNNAADALEDEDRDALSNVDEYRRGTNMRVPDTDGDGLSDGDEVQRGTNPLLFDTDGDGVSDGLEVQTGSNPLNPSSVNLAQALNQIVVAPTTFALSVNSISGEASVQLTVTGQLRDGTTIDLTSTTRGTNYASSNLNVCNFGSPDGRVFAGSDGPCTITITNSGFQAQAEGTVTSFAPTALGFVAVPGFANNVDVSGDFAYVAAGASGLQAVNVANRAAPVVVGSLDTPGNANDVKVVGNLAFVADGSSGLRIIDVTNPAAMWLVGSLDTAGDAWDVTISGNKAYVADGDTGLRIIDVSNPALPQLLGSVDPPGRQKGVEVDAARMIAVMASSTSGIHVINVANPASPQVLGSVSTGGDARDVALKGTTALVADGSRSFTVVNVEVPASPVLGVSLPQALGGLLNDIVVQGDFALGADVFFVNGVPIISVQNPLAPNPRAILSFANFRDDDGQGVAADASYVYLAAVAGSAFIENGTTGNSRLYIGQYLSREDRGGVPPTVSIVSPVSGGTFTEGSTVPIRAEATDDVAVARVDFLVNGNVAFTDTSAPFEYGLTAPAPSQVTIGARAVDLGGNTATAAEVTITTTPNPPPTVTITSPNSGATFIEGSAIPFHVTASDNGQVVRVDFLVNGAVAASDTSAPYEYNLTAPPVGTVTLGARAVDNVGAEGTATPITITTVPDPLTRVVGRVLNREGAPVSGAAVSLFTFNTTTAGDGTFAIEGVPTVRGDLIVSASAMVDGRTARGRSTPTAPVPSGTTNVGDITLRGGRVIFLYADSTAQTIKQNIVATGLIAAEDIDTMDVRSTTPTLAQLADYSAVLVWSNYTFANPTAIGNVLADFVDQGGGVVTATFTHMTGWSMEGRLVSGGYTNFVKIGTTGSNTLSLANSDMSHPIMAGVTSNTSLSFGYTDYNGYSLRAGATVVARDTTNYPKVAVNATNAPNRVVSIAIYPGHGLAADLSRMFANAIDFVR